jgi:dipeptidyl aminopeptidase/acylaminoacyl peptidase
MVNFNFDEFLALPRLSGLRLSPDGGRLVASVQTPAPDGKKMRSAIWQLDAAGRRSPVRLTRSAPGESVGAFEREGALLFTSGRSDPDRVPADDAEEDEVSALWLLPSTGGEARLLCAPAGGVKAVIAARAADTIVFSANVFAGATDLDDDLRRQAARKKAGVEAMLFESYPIRHWDHWLAPRELHLFAARLDASRESISDPTDLTPQAGSALEETDFDLTADGRLTVVAWHDRSDLTDPRDRLLAIDTASGSSHFLAELDRYSYSQPACSPDGRWVACVRSMSSDPQTVGDHTLYLFDLETGNGRDLTPGLDLWPEHPLWAPDAAAIYFNADRHGAHVVYRVTLVGGEVELLAADGAWSDLQAAPDGQTLFGLRASYVEPPKPARIELDEAAPRVAPIGSFAALDDLELPGRLERLTASASDGRPIESWLVTPRGAGPSERVPLVVWVHGGPLGSWQGWHWRWNPHLLAAHGYAVLLPDPALSTGYGLEFIQRGWGRWGAEPYTDVMAAYESALARPDIDAARTALMGGSFGGYMANWVAGKSAAFRAIVTHASLWELRGFHGTTDEGTWWEQEFGDPYTDDERYRAASPDRLVADIRTPMLVIHGNRDYRVPISEGLRLWTDLARHGVEAKFLYFPDENHWILKPQNARLWYETVLAFLDQHVLGKPWRRPDLL